MPNSYDLKDKLALVTGGAQGIGRAVVERFIASGAKVHVWDLAAVDEPGTTAQRVDIRDSDALEAALSQWGRAHELDILVNDAGYLGRAQPFASHDRNDWQRSIDVNLAGTMRVTQAILPHLVRRGRGRIVNFASLAAKEGLSGLAAYSAASAGVMAFTKALSREVVQQGVLVNCIAPGPIDTDMIRSLGPAVVEAMIGDSPMKRLGSPAEVAELVAWLCSDACSFNTGAVFDMSGGRARY